MSLVQQLFNTRGLLVLWEVGCTGPALYGVVPPTLQGRTHFPPILFSRLLFRLRDFTKLLVGILPTKKRKEYMAIIDVS
jgi:hypothetical protein